MFCVHCLDKELAEGIENSVFVQLLERMEALRDMEIIERAYDVLLIGSMLILAVLIICGIIRSVLGPKIADRIIAVNMIGTLTIILIALLSVYLGKITWWTSV